MNYKEYKVIDFLKDDGFKDWVLNPDLRKDIFWQETLEAFPEKRPAAEHAAGIKVWPENNRTEIALISGSVKVHHIADETEDIWLQPGEMVTHDIQSNQFVVSSFNFLEVAGWKDKILIFKGASLEEFVKRLEIWYDVQFNIIGETEETWSIDGEFNDISLEEVIKNLGFLYNIKYKIEGKIVTLEIL